MTKLKPIDRFVQDAKEGDLVRLIGKNSEVTLYVFKEESGPLEWSERIVRLTPAYPWKQDVNFANLYVDRRPVRISDMGLSYGLRNNRIQSYEILRRIRKRANE
jgi:hypothetical protein